MNTDTEPHIALTYQAPLIDAAIVEGFEEIVASKGLSVRVEPVEFMQVRAAIEWLIPTAVVAYLTKPYFESFLEEMGKDHYQLLKRGLLAVHKRIMEKYGSRIKMYGSKGKIDPRSHEYSPVFSIEAQSSTNHCIKLLIQTEISEDELSIVIDKFLDLLLQEHGIENTDESNLPILEAKPISRIILVALDQETGYLEVVDVFDHH